MGTKSLNSYHSTPLFTTPEYYVSFPVYPALEVPSYWTQNSHHFIISDTKSVATQYLKHNGIDILKSSQDQSHQALRITTKWELLELLDSLLVESYFLHYPLVQVHLLPGYSNLFNAEGWDVQADLDEVQEVLWALACSTHLSHNHEIDIETGYPAILKPPESMVWPARYHRDEVRLSAAEQATWGAVLAGLSW